jgi:hypothetical protein
MTEAVENAKKKAAECGQLASKATRVDDRHKYQAQQKYWLAMAESLERKNDSNK